MRRILKVRKGICIAASAVVIATALLLPLLAPRRRLDIPGASTPRVHSTEYSPVSVYCNFPDENRIAEEGAVVGTAARPLELVSVTVVLRHGDRFHMSSSRLGGLASPAVSCRLAASASSDGDDDAAVVRRFIVDMDQMVATGSAGWPLPPYPNVSACAPGRMSPAGVRQQLRNGRQLRAAYAARLNLSSVRAVSTAFERTYQSSLAFLHGLNPRLDWSRLDIERAADTRFCSPAAIGGSCACPYAEVLDREARAEARAALQGHDAAHAAFAERAVLVLGRRGGAAVPYPWEGAFDFLSQFACRRLRPPCGSDGGGSRCFRNEDVSTLWQHLQVYSRRLYAVEPFVRKCRIEAHPLLSAIGARLTAFARRQGAFSDGIQLPSERHSDNRAARMLVYSGHDVTVTPLAVALGVPLSGWPPYASRLVFEQYRDSDSGGSGSRTLRQRRRSRHYVRVLYNGVDVTRHMHFCSAGQSAPATDAAGSPTTLCALEEFASFASRHNLEELGYGSWRDACRGRVQRVASRQPPAGKRG